MDMKKLLSQKVTPSPEEEAKKLDGLRISGKQADYLVGMLELIQEVLDEQPSVITEARAARMITDIKPHYEALKRLHTPIFRKELRGYDDDDGFDPDF